MVSNLRVLHDSLGEILHKIEIIFKVASNVEVSEVMLTQIVLGIDLNGSPHAVCIKRRAGLGSVYQADYLCQISGVDRLSDGISR